MAQLARRLAELYAQHGYDPAAHQADLHALEALESTDAKRALHRFHAMRHELAVRHRSEMLRALHELAFVRDLPPDDVRGMTLNELRREARELKRALSDARKIRAALDAARAAHEQAGARAPPHDDALWRSVGVGELAAAAELAEAHRRVVAREARIMADVRRVTREARKLRHHAFDVEDVTNLGAEEADALIAEAHGRVMKLAAVEDAHRRVQRTLRDPAVRAWRQTSRKRLLQVAEARLQAADLEGLRALGPEAGKLHAEAARASENAARARRSGRAPPSKESRPGDAMDGYG